MHEIDDEVVRRLDELDRQIAPLRAEAQEILTRTRPGFRPFFSGTYCATYVDRAIGADAFYARARERAADTRRRNLEAKRLAEPPKPKSKSKTRGFFVTYGPRKVRQGTGAG